VAVFAKENLPGLLDKHLKALLESDKNEGASSGEKQESKKETLSPEDVSLAFKLAFLELDRDLSHLDYCY